jgi:hypothetical protein
VHALAAGSPSEASLLSSLSVASQLGGKAAIQSMELPDHQLMLQLVTQSAAQPGILTCWLDILALAKNSAQFYVAELPAGLEGRPYMDVRRWAQQADSEKVVPCRLLCPAALV